MGVVFHKHPAPLNLKLETTPLPAPAPVKPYDFTHDTAHTTVYTLHSSQPVADCDPNINPDTRGALIKKDLCA